MIVRKFRIWQKNEQPVDIIERPYQHLGEMLMKLASSARAKAANGTKDLNEVLKEIDRAATNASTTELSEEQLLVPDAMVEAVLKLKYASLMRSVARCAVIVALGNVAWSIYYGSASTSTASAFLAY